MVYRIYVEKKPGFDGEAQGLLHELVDLVGIKSLTGLRLLNRYDVEGIDNVLFQQAVPTVFSEPPVDVTYDKLPEAENVFAVEYLPGQFDQRADSASECIQLLSQGERPAVRSARVYLLQGALTEDDLAAIKKYVINPVEAREASLDERTTLKMEFAIPTEVETLTGFTALAEDVLEEFADLARSAGASVAATLTARIDKPSPATLIGSGKLEEVKAAAAAVTADCDHDGVAQVIETYLL